MTFFSTHLCRQSFGDHSPGRFIFESGDSKEVQVTILERRVKDLEAKSDDLEQKLEEQVRRNEKLDNAVKRLQRQVGNLTNPRPRPKRRV